MKFETRAIHVGEEPNLKDGGSGDVVVPIHLASTFARLKVDEPTAGYEYSRSGNPTRDALEKRLAALEQADFAFAFSSGLASETVTCLTILKPGDHVIAFDDLYGGTRRLFDSIFHRNCGVEYSYVDARDPANVEKSLRENTRLVWLETPTNPLMKVCDIAAICKLVKNYNPEILVAVDNTFMSSYFQNPLKLGADIVMHSMTKYMSGHSDSIGGAIMVSGGEVYILPLSQECAEDLKQGNISPAIRNIFKTNGKPLSYKVQVEDGDTVWNVSDQQTGQKYSVRKDSLKVYAKLSQELKYNQNSIGAILSPFDCYLVLRGTKTLAVRMEQHTKNAQEIVKYLEQHPKVMDVYYPGKSGMVSFTIEGGVESAKKFLETVKVFALAESLGGVESLIEHPASMTHAFLSQEDRDSIGLSDSLIRISVGIENIEDLLQDIKNALDAI